MHWLGKAVAAVAVPWLVIVADKALNLSTKALGVVGIVR